VTASYGVDGFTDAHLAAFQQHAVRKVLIAYDRDEAGDRAAAALTERLTAEGIASGRVEFPHGMDANAYALKVTPAAKSLGVLLRRAGGTCAPAVPDLSEPETEASKAAAKEESPAHHAAMPPADANAILASRASSSSPVPPLAAALPAIPPASPAAATPPAAADGPSTSPARPGRVPRSRRTGRRRRSASAPAATASAASTAPLAATASSST
jgi:DNA primase